MILRKATEHGVAAGIHNGTPEYALRMIEKGFRFVTIGSGFQADGSGCQRGAHKDARGYARSS